jgi:hypothetical protein
MSITAEQLYGLLPAIYRERDAALAPNGGTGPLYDIVNVIAGQFSLVDAEIDRLYDDAFIETCAQWVIPYIGDLVGYLPLSQTAPGGMSPRAEAANTIRYRRWKGTLTILEQLASDVTGWAAAAVEFFEQLTTTQYVNHIRLHSTATVNVRDWRIASSVGSPFDRTSHAIEVRSIATRSGRYNIPSVGVYVWRLASYDNLQPSPDLSQASQAYQRDANWYTFDPCGISAPLYNVPPPSRTPFTRTQPQNVPSALRVRTVADPATRPLYLGANPVFAIRDDAGALIPPDQIEICDFSTWKTPTLPGGCVAAVDAALGRIWVAPRNNPLLVHYAYGFSGPYGASFAHRAVDQMPATETITRDTGSFAPSDTLENAASAASVPNGAATVIYLDSVTDPNPTTIVLDVNSNLTIAAADYRRPILQQPLAISVNGTPENSATLTINGLLLEGGVVVRGTGTLDLTISNATIRPPSGGGAAIAWSGASGSSTLERTLCGSIALADIVTAAISDSIVDGGTGSAIAAESLTLVRSTVFGDVSVEQVGLIENSVVTGKAASTRLQAGCVRYSFISPGSSLPQQYRCQPQLALEADLAHGDAAAAALDRVRIIPQFNAIDYGDPAYGQLAGYCPVEITTGADDGGEMGVFHDLFITIRERNLQIRLAENIRMGLNAGVLYA